MKHVDRVAFCVLAGVAYFATDLSAFAAAVPAPSVGVGPLVFSAITIIAAAAVYIRSQLGD